MLCIFQTSRHHTQNSQPRQGTAEERQEGEKREDLSREPPWPGKELEQTLSSRAAWWGLCLPRRLAVCSASLGSGEGERLGCPVEDPPVNLQTV